MSLVRRGHGAARVEVLALICVAAIWGCERSRSGGQQGALPSTPPTESAANARGPSARLLGWNDTLAGPSLFVVGANNGEAVDVIPRYSDSTITDAPATDSVLGRHPHVDLFARRGAVGSTVLTPASNGNFAGSCTTWPTAHVSTKAGPPPDWSVGLTSGHATALPMDSVGGLAAPDSSRRAAAIARAASALPSDTALAFRGLPFAVRDAHRFVLPSGDTVMVAEVVRRLNQEANPQEEHLLMILERDTVAGPGGSPPPYVVTYSERASGPEDDVETSDVLAAVLLAHSPRPVPAVIIGRDYGDGNSYTVIERVGPRRWRARWNSAYVGC